jgi:hypothetical protein
VELGAEDMTSEIFPEVDVDPMPSEPPSAAR